MPENIDSGIDQGVDQGLAQTNAVASSGSSGQTNQQSTAVPVDWNISGGIDQGIDQYGTATQGETPTGATSPQIVGPLSILPLTGIGLVDIAFSWNAGDTQPAIRFKVMDTGAGQFVDTGVTGVVCTLSFIIPGQSSAYDTLTATTSDGITWEAQRLPTDPITVTSGRFFLVAKFVYSDLTQFSVPDDGSFAIVDIDEGF